MRDGTFVPLRSVVAFSQAAYFLVTGVWPVLHIRSFEWITGPKIDRWLVKTVGVVVSIVGSAIGLAAWRRRLTPEIELLAIGSALALAVVDIVYVTRRRISKVYLLDAAAELTLAIGWAAARRTAPSEELAQPVGQEPSTPLPES